MATGTAVATGDIITAAKMNLKQETGVSLANLSVVDQSGAGSFALAIVVSETLTANRNLTIVVNNVARTIDLSGNLTLAAALTTVTAAITLTADAAGSSVTLPASGTLATLAGTETLTNKTITAATFSGTFPGTPTFSGATITFTGGAIALTGGAAYSLGTTDAFALNLRAGGGNRLGISNTIGSFTVYQTTANYTLTFADPAAARTITFPDPLGADSVAYLAASQTFTNKTINGAALSGTLTGTPSFSGTVAFTAASPFSVANAQTLTVSVTAQTVGAATLTIPNFANVSDTFAFLTLAQTLTNKTLSLSGDLTFASALDIELQANTALALEVNAGAVAYLAIDTRTATDGVIANTWDLADPTFVSAAGSAFSMMRHNAFTVNLTGGVLVTAMNGVSLEFQAPTIAANAATTITTASLLYLRPITAGGNITITNSRMIDTSVAGCFLTAAGVWTDASSIQHKTGVRDVDWDEVLLDIQQVRPVTYIRKDASDGGFRRYGVIAEEVPDFLATPEHNGIAALDLAGFALAALKGLVEKHQALQQRVKELESAIPRAR